MWELIIEQLPSIVFLLISVSAIYGIRKLSLKKEVEDAIISLTKRVVDKCEEMVGASVKPDSDGGAAITRKEFSDIRQMVWDLLGEELEGPNGTLLKKWGEDRVKGLIGIVLTKMGIRETLGE